MFAELLRSRLAAIEPGDVARLHRAAAAWYAEHDRIDDAIRHALDAGDTDLAAGWTEERDEAATRAGQVAIPGTPERLTEREFAVLELVAAGRTNRRIADELFITIDTVKRHVTHLLDKLGVHNRTEAAAQARRFGLLG